jgi:hypothetical protein
MPRHRVNFVPSADPVLWGRALWPNVRFYEKQRQVIYSVRDNDETYCYAGHQLGKDYVAGFIILWYFLTNPEVRIVTTSVKDDHLRVLWGEIGRYIDTVNPEFPLKKEHGGPLIVTHREIKKLVPYIATSKDPTTKESRAGQYYIDKISYVRGMVSEKGEGMAGHHAPKTLLVIDEASGVDEMVPERASSWAKKILVIGNPYGGSSTWFYRNCMGGDILYGSKKELGRH